jgi:CheY-like chemotaxis protein
LFLHLVEERVAEGNPARPVSERLGGLYEVLNNKTVLIADDDVRNIFSLTKALEQHKMNVLAATDGKEALQALKDNPLVDIVLMDMMMPEMDGYETTRQIRKMPVYRNLPVLAVTAKAMMGDREKCIAAGASDYISKPVDVDQLTSLLRVWLYDKV